MISELNTFFSKHKKFVWITLGAAMIVPLALMVPNTDSIFDRKQEKVKIGQMYGKDIDPKEFRKFYTNSTNTVVIQMGFGMFQQFSQYGNFLKQRIEIETFKRIRALHEIEKLTKTKKISDKITKEDMKQYLLKTNIFQNPYNRKKTEYSSEIVTKTRKNLRMTGLEFDTMLKENILIKRFEDSIVADVTVNPVELRKEFNLKNEKLTFYKKEYLIDDKKFDFLNKEARKYYRENKDQFKEQGFSVKAVLVSFPVEHYRSKIDYNSLGGEIRSVFKKDKKKFEFSSKAFRVTQLLLKVRDDSKISLAKISLENFKKIFKKDQELLTATIKNLKPYGAKITDLGWVSNDSVMAKVFTKAVLLKKNELSDIAMEKTSTATFLKIYQVTGEKTGQLTPAVKEKISADLIVKKSRELARIDAIKFASKILKTSKNKSELQKRFKQYASQIKHRYITTDFVREGSENVAGITWNESNLVNHIIKLTEQQPMIKTPVLGKKSYFVPLFLKKGSKYKLFSDVKKQVKKIIYSKLINAYYNSNKKSFEIPEKKDAVLAIFEDKKFLNSIPITEKDIKKYYEENSFEFKKKEAKIGFIFLPFGANANKESKENIKKKAQLLVDELKSKKDVVKAFPLYAKLHSKHKSAENGGTIDYFSEYTAPKGVSLEVINEIFTLKKETLSKAIKSANGYNIFYIYDLRQEQSMKIASLKIRSILQKKNSRTAAYNAALKLYEYIRPLEVENKAKLFEEYCKQNKITLINVKKFKNGNILPFPLAENSPYSKDLSKLSEVFSLTKIYRQKKTSKTTSDIFVLGCWEKTYKSEIPPIENRVVLNKIIRTINRSEAEKLAGKFALTQFEKISKDLKEKKWDSVNLKYSFLLQPATTRDDLKIYPGLSTKTLEIGKLYFENRQGKGSTILYLSARKLPPEAEFEKKYKAFKQQLLNTKKQKKLSKRYKELEDLSATNLAKQEES